MASYRKGKIDEEMARTLSGILRTVKDPRVANSLVSIVAVDCSADLKYAKVFYSYFSQKYDGKDVAAGLKSAAGLIRSRLAQTMNLRITPELTFVEDDSIRHGAHINELLKSVAADLVDKPEETETAESKEND